MAENQTASPGLEGDAEGRPLPDAALVDDVKAVIAAAAAANAIDVGGVWQCFSGDDSAISRWKREGKKAFTTRLIAMFEGYKSGAGYRGEGASLTWEQLLPHLRLGAPLAPRLKDYLDRLERHEWSERLGRAQARAARRPEASALDDRPSSPRIVRAKIRDEERLFSVLPFFGQSDARGADLILGLSFGAPNREITDDEGEPSAPDTINVAINRCALHVDWPSGDIRGQSWAWSNTSEIEHTLEMLGTRRARVWQMESSVPGAPIRGVFEDQHLCWLEGPDRSDVRVRLSFTVSDLKITSKHDGDLVGNDRLRVFKRFLAQTVEHEFDQNSSLTVFEGPVQTLDGT